jgi:hypothetical protein
MTWRWSAPFYAEYTPLGLPLTASPTRVELIDRWVKRQVVDVAGGTGGLSTSVLRPLPLVDKPPVPPAVDSTGVENPIKSRNLRPENGLPAGLTFAQFVDVMRNGTDYDHPGRLLQVMQWPIFQNMTDRDLLAIYEYLGAVPP